MEALANKQVVVAEDNPDDAFFLQHAFQEAKIPNPCMVLRDGREVQDYLWEPARAQQCCLVVTDLKMQRLDGFALLSWMRKQEHLRGLPAVVLTSSADEGDRRRALELGAQEFLVKPGDLRGLVALAQRLRERWVEPHCNKQVHCGASGGA